MWRQKAKSTARWASNKQAWFEKRRPLHFERESEDERAVVTHETRKTRSCNAEPLT